MGYYSDDEGINKTSTSPLLPFQVRARFYNPMSGRWISPDPLGYDAVDPNLYRYVRNNPINAVDPSGLILPPASFKACEAARAICVAAALAARALCEAELPNQRFACLQTYSAAVLACNKAKSVCDAAAAAFEAFKKWSPDPTKFRGPIFFTRVPPDCSPGAPAPSGTT